MALEIPVDAIRELVATLAGVAESRVYWHGEPEKHIGPIAGKAGKITLTMTASVVGELEPRREYSVDMVVPEWDPETEEEPDAVAVPKQTTEWGETETITVTIRADNFIGLGKAYDTLRKVRRGFRYPSALAALRDADLSYLESPSIQSLSNQAVDNRIISSAVMDVKLSFLASEVPEGEDGNQGWIEKVSSKAYPPGDPTTAPVYDLEGDFEP